MSTQVSTTQKKSDIRTLIQSEQVKAQMALVLPKHLTADRMARVACTAILRTPKLLECRPESLLQALMLCSQAGLEPDGRNAHLIPYGDQCQLIIDWKGLVALAERNGCAENIYADKVCDNDEFSACVVDGVKKLTHTINWKKDRGPAYAYYCSCRRNGHLDYEVMTLADVQKIKARSKAGNSGPWVSDFDEMAKKTTIRRMSKRWDLAPEVTEIIDSEDDTPGFSKPKAPSFSGPDMGLPELPQETTPEPQKEPEPGKVVELPKDAVQTAKVSDKKTPHPTDESEESKQARANGTAQGESEQAQSTAQNETQMAQTVPGGSPSTKPYETIVALCKEHGIADAQVLAVGKAKRLINPSSTDLMSVADGKLKLMAANWANILPDLKAAKV